MQAETTAQRQSWDDFHGDMEWRQGEHVSIIGPTGRGKTTLGLALVEQRRFVVIVATKPEDETLEQMGKRDWWITEEWRAGMAAYAGHVIFWPTLRKPDDVKEQQRKITALFDSLFREKRWTVYVDEAWYVNRVLGLERVLELYWQQARSLKISLVAGTQRPAHVPLLMYDQPTHLFFFRDNDPVNLKRIGGIGGMNPLQIRERIESLESPHDFLYVNTRTGRQAISRVEHG